MLLNLNWWVNRKDPSGRNVFWGGFLGLDNIGVFDRSAPLPTGGHVEQDDVVLGGGNAKMLKELPPGCRAGANANAFFGRFRLWEKGVEHPAPIADGSLPMTEGW